MARTFRIQPHTFVWGGVSLAGAKTVTRELTTQEVASRADDEAAAATVLCVMGFDWTFNIDFEEMADMDTLLAYSGNQSATATWKEKEYTGGVAAPATKTVTATNAKLVGLTASSDQDNPSGCTARFRCEVPDGTTSPISVT